MARVTVEDCLENVDNRFQLVLLASRRARDLERRPDTAQVPWNDDKPTVVALREIAQGFIKREYLEIPQRRDRFEAPPRMTPRVEFTGDIDDDFGD